MSKYVNGIDPRPQVFQHPREVCFDLEGVAGDIPFVGNDNGNQVALNALRSPDSWQAYSVKRRDFGPLLVGVDDVRIQALGPTIRPGL